MASCQTEQSFPNGYQRVWWRCGGRQATGLWMIVRLCCVRGLLLGHGSLIQIIKRSMNCQNQWVISLTKLALPADLHSKRLTLSVLTPAEEIFLQNYKIIKNSKVNFYRESIFLPAPPHQLSFTLYQLDDQDHKTIIKHLQPDPSALAQINPRPTVFKTCSEGFCLDWEGWVFLEGSEELNDCTERDYSELDLPFYNYQQPHQSQMLLDSDLTHHHPQPNSKNTKPRSSSTEGSSSHEHRQLCSSRAKDASRGGSLAESKGRSPCKERTKIKSHIYSQLVRMASELFCHGSSP